MAGAGDQTHALYAPFFSQMAGWRRRRLQCPPCVFSGGRYSEGAVGYLTGILPAGELLPAVRLARDAAIRRIVVEALLQELNAGAAATHRPPLGLADRIPCADVPGMSMSSDQWHEPSERRFQRGTGAELPDGLRRTAQATANAAALAGAAQALDEFTILRARSDAARSSLCCQPSDGSLRPGLHAPQLNGGRLVLQRRTTSSQW